MRCEGNEMNVEVSPETKQKLDQRLATGRYASPDELLQFAPDALARQEQGDEHAQFVADLKESLEDERAGRTHSLQEIDVEFRAKYSPIIAGETK
jgi:Arc/MetJ-type ribon-helix-helix transcriptional regulator